MLVIVINVWKEKFKGPTGKMIKNFDPTFTER